MDTTTGFGKNSTTEGSVKPAAKKGSSSGGLTKVSVYWNLHKNIWSLREKGKVVAHMGTVGLRDVTLRVQPAGRAKVLREGRKNVHAFAHGTYDHGLVHDVLWAKVAEKGREITYNPYKYETFVYKDDLTPAVHCDRIVMIGRQLWEVVDA